MKSSLSLITLLCAPVAVYTATSAEVPPALMNIPGDGMRLTGESVQPQPTPEFLHMQQQLSTKLAQLPADKKKAFFSTYNATELLPYSPELWENEAAYARYCEEWKKIAVEPIQTVQVGTYDRGNGEWGLHGVSFNAFTRAVSPLAVNGLVYNAAKNTWTTSNGELTAQELSTGRNNIYGARKGTTWRLSKTDAMSALTESLSISRRTNGEFLYLSYSFKETTPDGGTNLAQGSYVLRFRVGNPAPEPEEPAVAPPPPAPKPVAEKAKPGRPKAKDRDRGEGKRRRAKDRDGEKREARRPRSADNDSDKGEPKRNKRRGKKRNRD
ncbi:MAG: hypothetical protein II295_02090 [Akkermansia sp.]|nr:hypothetical protein [Akkermansia sp.]